MSATTGSTPAPTSSGGGGRTSNRRSRRPAARRRATSARPRTPEEPVTRSVTGYTPTRRACAPQATGGLGDQRAFRLAVPGEGDDRPVALGERVRDGGEALDLPALERDPVVALAGPGVHDDERPPRATRREERAHTRAIRVRDRQPPGGRRPG